MMASNTLIIKELVRNPQYGPEDKLEFSPGVNLIIGPSNSGKTKWLNMLDYLMGDSGQPEKAFPLDLVDKYKSVGARLSIDGKEHVVERRWKEKGSKGKVFVGEKGMDAADFQDFLLDELKIPVLHFPKGNPYDEKSWPELSWRILYRHIYRQQRFWADIADKQPSAEQHAVLMQFLGIAEHLYSGKSGEMVEKRKELWKALGVKEQYMSLVDQISREVSDEEEIQFAVTPQTVDLAINRLNTEIKNLQNQRTQALVQLQNKTDEKTGYSIGIDSLSREWAKINTEKNDYQGQLSRLGSRLEELDRYSNSINNEISKMERARKAGQVLVDLKVRNCPICDQPVKHNDDKSDHCYLCGQPWEENKTDGTERIDAEIRRLQDEKQEVIELIRRLSLDRDKLVRVIRLASERIQLIENQLTPIRQAASSILPPEIGVIDMEKGRLQERIRQLERIKVALDYHKQLSKKIDDLNEQIGMLEAEVKLDASKIRFAYSGDLLADGMNSYVSTLEASGRRLWQHDRIKVALKDRSFNFTIQEDEWTTKLGGTSVLYFLLSYHYGLLSLTNKEDCHYPGLVILDLPATFLDGSSIRDKENFIAEPFIQLVNTPEMRNTQVILTGQAFEGLENVNRITFSTIWK